MTNLSANFHIVKNMLRDKNKKNIEEIKMDFYSERFSKQSDRYFQSIEDNRKFK